MKINTTALIAWFWGIVRDAIEGFAHGAIIGSGVGSIATHDITAAFHSAVLGGLIGAGKQALLYLNSHSIPDLLLAAPPVAAPSVEPKPAQ